MSWTLAFPISSTGIDYDLFKRHIMIYQPFLHLLFATANWVSIIDESDSGMNPFVSMAGFTRASPATSFGGTLNYLQQITRDFLFVALQK